MGFSGKQKASICFLLAVLLIALTLGSLTFLINDNAASLPDVGLGAVLEGNCDHSEGMTVKEQNTMKKNKKDLIKNTKNAPPHSTAN